MAAVRHGLRLRAPIAKKRGGYPLRQLPSNISRVNGVSVQYVVAFVCSRLLRGADRVHLVVMVPPPALAHFAHCRCVAKASCSIVAPRARRLVGLRIPSRGSPVCATPARNSVNFEHRIELASLAQCAS